jgi:hypothetical protein
VKQDLSRDNFSDDEAIAKARVTLYEPSGQKISDAFIIPKSPYFDEARRAVKILNGVHGDGALERLKVIKDVTLESHSDGPGLAAYDRYIDTDEPLGWAVNPKRKWKGIHLFHEVGHALDHQMLGTPLVYASDAKHPELKSWRSAVEQSRLYQGLVALRDLEFATIRRQGRTVIEPITPATVEYYLRPKELFARSYAHYVASTSGDNVTLRQLAALRGTPDNQLVYNDAWDDDDFESIAQAFEALFFSKGWLK